MAKARSIGSTYVEMMLKDINFRKGLKSVEKSLNNFASGAAKVGVRVGQGMAVAGAAIAAGMVVGVKRTLEQTDALNDLSNQTGVAVADAMLLGRAYQDGGREAAMMGKDIGKMQKALVTAQQGGDNPFKALGLSVEELMKQNPADQFKAIGDAIMRIENPAQRTAKAMEIFGKGGMGLTTVFGGMAGAEKALGRMPELASRFANAMGEANDLIGHLPMKSDQFFMGFTAGIIGELLPNLQLIDEHDFTTLGENLGKSLSTGLEMLTDGSVWQIFQLHAEKVANYLRTDFLGGFVNAWSAAINTAIDAFSPGDGNFSIGGAFDKYSQAGFDANAEKNAEIDKRIADIVAGAAARAAAKTADAAAMGKSGTGISNVIDTLAADRKKPTGGSSWEKSAYEINDYQKRGLALNKNPLGLAGDKQLTVLEAIRDVLERAATDGKLVWD